MKTLIATAVFAGLGLAFVSFSQAMPIAPLDTSQLSTVTPVFGGCEFGMHRGPYGGCRPLFNCPPGFHTGPYGRHCFRN